MPIMFFGLEGSRTGVPLQARGTTSSDAARDEVRPADPLVHKLLAVQRTEEDQPRLLAISKPHSYSFDSVVSTSATSCGAATPRTRASTEDLTEFWTEDEEAFGAEDEGGAETAGKAEALQQASTRAGSRSPCRRSSGYTSLSSLTKPHTPICLVSRKGEQAHTASPPLSTCFSGCLSWLFLSGKTIQQQPFSTWSSEENAEYDLTRLTRVGLLGFGSFGAVTLEKCQTTGACFALKAISKGLLAQRGLHNAVKMEKEAMRRCDSPFIVRLVATFSGDQHLYFLLEAVLGGDLYACYARRFLFGSEVHARFYMACLVRALEHLHERGIIYRDIKMENIVLDARGYGKLCDFGLSVVLREGDCGRAYTVCGTPEYMAPEVASSTYGYTRAADWWSLGVLVYELMVGDVPFVGEDRDLVHLNASQGIEAAQLPAESWAEVVCGLCQLDPELRLPMRECGMEELESQAWFTGVGFDWKAHARCQMPAPHVPKIAGPEDLSNFSTGQQLPPPAVFFDSDSSDSWNSDFEDRVGPRVCRG